MLTAGLGLTPGAAQAGQLTAGVITTFAGGGTSNPGNGGAAIVATLGLPSGVAVDGAGNVYIAEYGGARVRKVALDGTITTVAGTGVPGFGGDGGPATAAQLRNAFDLAVDKNGNLYITDSGNNRVRKVDTSGIITTIAGTGILGSTGDGGAAIAARLAIPYGVAVDGVGNVYVAENGGNRVRKISTSGVISTVVGTGILGFSGDGGSATAAKLNNVIDVAVDKNGNLYITDSGNNRVRKIDASGIITTIAGTGLLGASGDNGPATGANLGLPYGLVFDNNGNLYVAQYGVGLVREITTDGIIKTVAGTGILGFGGDGGAATAALLNAPYGLAVDKNGNLLIADFLNNRVRQVASGLFNQAPVATAQNVTGNEDTKANGTLKATDADAGDTLTFAKESDPAHGTVVVNSNGNFTYTPAADFNGSDSFTFVANDGTTDSAPAKVTINVAAVNDAPSFVVGPNQSVQANSGAHKLKGFARQIKTGPADEARQRFNFVVTNNNNALFSVQPILNTNGALIYTLAPGQVGKANLSVKLKDNGGTNKGGIDTSAAQTFAIDVVDNRINFSVSLAPQLPLTNDTLTATPSTIDSRDVTLLYEYFVNGTRVQRGSRGTGNTLNLRSKGFGDKGDVVKVVVTATNPSNGGTGQAVSSVRVSNSAPMAVGGTAKAQSGVETLIPLTLKGAPGASDVDGDMFFYRRAGKPANGTAEFESSSNGSGVLHYTSRPGFVGTEDVKFYAVDSDNAYSNVGTIRITVTANGSASASAIQSGGANNAPSGGAS